MTQEKAKLDAKIKHNDAMIAEGKAEELTEFEMKKIEKERQVIELRERLQKLKDKVIVQKYMFMIVEKYKYF